MSVGYTIGRSAPYHQAVPRQLLQSAEGGIDVTTFIQTDDREALQARLDEAIADGTLAASLEAYGLNLKGESKS